MTQVDFAKKGKITPEMRRVALDEGIDAEFIRKGLVNGTIVIPKNTNRRAPKPCGIGSGLRTKINANIGTSKDSSDVSHELKKMEEAIKLGADAVMDLSTGPNLGRTRRKILSESNVPVGTVPIYEMAIEGLKRHGSIAKIEIEEMFEILEKQAAEGVDFFTIHAGVTKKALGALKKGGRLLDIVSRGGAFLAEWMITNNKENPFYDNFGRVMDIAKRYDITLSLGDGLRPGSVADATDKPQITELIVLGELQKIALDERVQVIIEGPGPVPINQIKDNVVLEKSLCGGAPFYVLGPLVTDIAPGYDHITSAIGGAIAASAGADFLCYVTPSEHLRLPTIEDVRDGVIASKIAAHAADIAKGVKGAIDMDIDISRARAARDWKKQFSLAIDSEKAKRYRVMSKPGLKDVCTMCGEYCSIKTAEKCLALNDK
jgi:phosphomethylpyrimidine synthase